MGVGWCSAVGKSVAPTPEPERGGEPVPQDLSAPGTYGPDDPGGGPYDEVTGIREWYDAKPVGAPADETVERTFADILEHWTAIELDLDTNGHDIESGILETRSWRWLKLRIQHYATTPGTQLWDALHPKG